MAEELILHMHDNENNEPHRTQCKKYVPSNGITEDPRRVTCPECLYVIKQEIRTHRCEGRRINYLRGTPAGDGGQCTANAKVIRDGKYYCLLHDPVKVKERQQKRDEKEREEFEKAKKIYGFCVDGQRIYEIKARSESEAKVILVDRIIEVKIECLGELKKSQRPVGTGN